MYRFSLVACTSTTLAYEAASPLASSQEIQGGRLEAVVELLRIKCGLQSKRLTLDRARVLATQHRRRHTRRT